ncbi:hypothetical protein Tco_1516264 [Tanacetum coccineum]
MLTSLKLIHFFKTLKEHSGRSNKRACLFKEVKVMEEIFDQMNDEVDQNTWTSNLEVLSRPKDFLSPRTWKQRANYIYVGVSMETHTGKKFHLRKTSLWLSMRNPQEEICLRKLCPLSMLPVTYVHYHLPPSPFTVHHLQVHPPVFPQGVAAGPTIKDTSITQADLHPLVNPVEGEPSFAQSTSGDVSLAEPNQVNQPPDHLRKWTKDHL